ncbi:alpha/beta hydrolase [Sphingomonas sp. PP-CE-1G-424]|uniref:alpha/beta hydrolase n=1 Tax=Sphingomonas sp. PP-CE-1G-424 TaxID=2135658 RepID=UPI0010563EAB|nr:alpha/beta hydrolase [Sphingomonas sp. PP-CE-1G-424]TCP66562.1 pimeloyl-ACP methyl ester carboxylesterase [Sphingomonas sp. PP-CE-1G-424]
MSHLAIATLGILSVFQSTTAVPLPPSRKTRALLAYLVLATRPQRREHLIDLFWGDGPDDPRGALRWSLSKIRALIDTDRPRVIADRETVAFDAGEVTIDLHAARQIGPDASVDEIVACLTALRQPLLAGIDLPDNAAFQAWLVAEREATARLRRTLLQRLVADMPLSHEDRLPWCREWCDADPFNHEAAARLQTTLRELGRLADAKRVERDFSAGLCEAGLPRSPARPFEPAPSPEPAPASVSAPALGAGTDRMTLHRQKISFATTDDGVRIAYASVGDGPPLVKVANWLNHLELDWDAPVWAPLFHDLAQDYRFLRYDGRGNGMSDREVAVIDFDTLVHDLETVVNAAGVDRFPLLGISQGCAVAIEYAARHPERVSHLILWGGFAAGWRVIGTPDVRKERAAILTLVRQGWGRSDPAYRKLVTWQFMPGASAEELDWFDAFQREAVSAENAVRFANVFADIDVRHRLAGVTTPTLVMHGRGDRQIPLAVAGALAAAIPGAEFVTLDTENHVLLGREPAAAGFVAHIRQFLAEERRSADG